MGSLPQRANGTKEILRIQENVTFLEPGAKIKKRTPNQGKRIK